jgi:hypothetical protein
VDDAGGRWRWRKAMAEIVDRRLLRLEARLLSTPERS